MKYIRIAHAVIRYESMTKFCMNLTERFITN
ncbi:MAG: hypothetical protein METHAR1v1_410009 [Methanothrix sp.]|nr:MAG: hypothetical protein METHAR1v1_410009 [Methanothrix sp.]